MPKDGFLNVRMDKSLMEDVHAIFAALGVSRSEAISMIYAQVKMHQGFPFDVKIPNAQTIAAMREGEQPDKLKAYRNFAEVRAELEC